MLSRSQRSSPLDRPVIIGTLAGVVHVVVTWALWSVFRFENLVTTFSAEPLYVTYLFAGMFTVGFIPGLLYARSRTVSPALLVCGLLGVTAIGTWTITGTGNTPVGPTPFGWYALLWVGVALATSLAGGIESRYWNKATK